MLGNVRVKESPTMLEIGPAGLETNNKRKANLKKTQLRFLPMIRLKRFFGKREFFSCYILSVRFLSIYMAAIFNGRPVFIV